ncbi:MAG: hypothetical protein QXD11_00790 [Candidatus Micrarchaeaceae archaeon]
MYTIEIRNIKGFSSFIDASEISIRNIEKIANIKRENAFTMNIDRVKEA